MDLLECILPTRKVLVVPWIFALAVLHILVRWMIVRRNGRNLPDSLRVMHEAHWFGASFVVLMGVIYQPIIEAFAEVPAYLSIAAGVGLLETIRLLAR